MIFRRKKADGFDWHHYVRTTLLLRRQQRRARLDEIGRAAASQAQAAAKAASAAPRAVSVRLGIIGSFP